MGEDGIHNTVSMDRATLVGKARREIGSNKNNDTLNAKYPTTGDGTDENGARIN